MTGFFESGGPGGTPYVEPEVLSGAFVGEKEKDVLIETAAPFQVTAVSRAASQWGEQWLVQTTIEGEERLLPFKCESVKARDQLLSDIQVYLAQEDAVPPTVKLIRVGRSLMLVSVAGA